MTYHFEALQPERFQQFCQALLAAVFPNVQCLPVGQPDGGRDAFVIMAPSGGEPQEAIAFQVKFVRNADDHKDERAFIEEVVKLESPKVRRLLQSGLSRYYLLTNVRGTSHYRTGSVDRVNEQLSRALGLNAYCWWRDDLERRVDTHSDLKWSYPEILRGTDLLQALMEGQLLGEEARRRSDAIKAYIAGQYRDDEEVKFKQVELQNKILDLFVDVPVGPVRQMHARWRRRSVVRVVEADFDHDFVIDDDFVTASQARQRIPGAAAVLLATHTHVTNHRSVLEGAPGQGKSTITQYVCQVHRMRLLGKTLDIARVAPALIASDVRIPFRVDIRDYATWLAGNDPFSPGQDVPLAQGYNVALEAFLAAHVSQNSGGHAFSVSDLSAVAKASHITIVLDGFDEVADIAIRQQVVDEISKAATRLEATARSLQVIVTSRPAAFANSPGFSGVRPETS